jgi:hypothetical protein
MKEGTTTSNIVLEECKYLGDLTPNYVGGYRLGTDHYVQFNLTYRPNWFHRTMMRLCFGYKWVNL